MLLCGTQAANYLFCPRAFFLNNGVWMARNGLVVLEICSCWKFERFTVSVYDFLLDPRAGWS